MFRSGSLKASVSLARDQKMIQSRRGVARQKGDEILQPETEKLFGTAECERNLHLEVMKIVLVKTSLLTRTSEIRDDDRAVRECSDRRPASISPETSARSVRQLILEQEEWLWL